MEKSLQWRARESQGEADAFDRVNFNPNGNAFGEDIRTYINQNSTAAKSLASVNLSIQTSVASAERVFKIMDSSPQDNKNKLEKNNFESEIVYQNVSFNYLKDNQVISEVSLKINKGTTTAIVGKSGSGKSTLVNLLPRFYEINDGKILIDDINCKDISLESLRSMIAIVPQDSFSMSKVAF